MKLGIGISQAVPPQSLQLAGVMKSGDDETPSYAFNITTDTYGKLNSDGNYYNLVFPYDFVDVDDDLFAEHREDGEPAGDRVDQLLPIEDALDIIINIPTGTEIGSNSTTGASGAGAIIPSFRVIYSGSLEGYHEAGGTGNPLVVSNTFTETAAKSLSLTINNSGNVSGGGGHGGIGSHDQAPAAGKSSATAGAGGGGGGGAGIHDNGLAYPYPGQGGTKRAGSSAQDGVDGGHVEGGAGGTGAAGNISDTNDQPGGDGQLGGTAFQLYALQHNTVVTLVNKDDAYIYGGGGGGGGGDSLDLTGGGDGGDGGSIGGGAGATGEDRFGVAGYQEGDGGAGGRVANVISYAGTTVINITNDHDTGTVKGTDGTW